MKISKEKTLPLIMSALREDLGTGDITSYAVFEKDVNVMADIIAKQDCILSGIDVAKWVFAAVDERVIFRGLCKDGDIIKKGKKVVSLKGSIRAILSAERTALNFLSRLSGVSVITNKFVKKVKGTKVQVLDTRKTTPGFRELEKYAVRLGGGYNHRLGLYDSILIKDNHIKGAGFVLHTSRSKVIAEIIKMSRARGYKNIELEVENLRECSEAMDAGVDILLLDNMKIEDIKKAVKLRKSKRLKTVLEVSGGVNLENIAKIAKTGVDRISVGALTHSASSIDFSLEICSD